MASFPHCRSPSSTPNSINILKYQKIEANGQAVWIESERKEREIKQILDRVLKLGEGYVAVGIERAVEARVLDNPFATSPHVLCKVLGLKTARER